VASVAASDDGFGLPADWAVPDAADGAWHRPAASATGSGDRDPDVVGGPEAASVTDSVPAADADVDGTGPGPGPSSADDAAGREHALRPAEAVRLRSAERRRRDEVARLEHLRGDADRRRAVLREIAEIERRLAAIGPALEGPRRRTEELPAERERAAAELAEARGRSGSREHAAEALEAARRRHGAAEAHARIGRELAAAERRRVAAVDAAQAAVDALHEVRRARIAGMAAELAARLADGDACPVCGSAEHPHPASGGADRPSPEDEERAEAAAEAARRARAAAEGDVASLTERRAAAAEAADGLDEEAARALVAEREAAVAAVDAAAARITRLEGRVAEIEAALDEARRTVGDLERERAELAERRTARAEEAERLAALLDAARGDDPDLAARIARLSGEADLLAAAAAALDRLAAAEEELRAAEREAERALAEAGFTGADAVRAAERAEGVRRELRERARRHDDELAAVRAVLDDSDLAAAAARPAPDTDGLRAALADAEAAAEYALAWRERAVRRAARLAELRAELEEGLAASRPARHRHAVADGLARLAAGTSPANRESVRLSAYVLAARLEQVVAAANDRLGTMSGGRYVLRHTVDKAAGDRTRSGGGLGLRVLDAWTGQERDPATLSGGETFFCSLALALGLGDVAGAESGGADIRTLFVDEGFGSLDEDTLEEVLEVLDALRDGGRAVGVVSHVADLRTRIPTRLTVRKSPTGSHLTQT
jgi:exonuclease SbcC